MAKNRVHEDGGPLDLDVSGVNGSGTGNLVLSGDPGAIGDMPFVALTDEDGDGNATCATKGVFDLAVTGEEDTPTDTAISPGDKVFYDDTLGQIDVGPNGVPFGYALDAVVAGATTTIRVRLQPGA